MMKRVFDLLFVLLMMPFLLVILLIVSTLILVNMGLPILFIQTRPGLYRRPFNMIKFRTMSQGKDSNDILLSDAQRLTRFGKLLRSTSLDELPSLWNVIKGDMSIVGPRPLLMEYLPLYTDEQNRRHDVRPGITGWAQVNGRNAISWEDKFKLDVWYVDNQSFFLDIKILFLTIFSVLKSKGISQEGHVTSEKFRGSK